MHVCRGATHSKSPSVLETASAILLLELSILAGSPAHSATRKPALRALLVSDRLWGLWSVDRGYWRSPRLHG